MQTGLNRSPAEAGSTSGKAPTGSNAALGGCVFDPRDIPFLPLWPEFPAVFPRFAAQDGVSGYVSNVAKDCQQHVQRKSAVGARSDE